MKIKKIISVCCQKDLKTWKTASSYIVRNIESDSYLVIVPDNEVNLFKENSPNNYEVLGESKYTNLFQAYLRAKISAECKSRLGWYLQQLIKMAVLKEFSNDEILLIWDSDTVPLKKISFLKKGLIGHYKGTEHHEAYFNCIGKLIGLPRKVSYSFVAQCLAIKGKWSSDFFADIERRHGKPWHEAIIDCIDFNEMSGFSEYETLGTFIQHHYPSEITILKNKWYRRGNALIGKAENLKFSFFRGLLCPFDFVAFENWDKPYRFYKIDFSKYLKIIFKKLDC
jgi:hypothetical protein